MKISQRLFVVAQKTTIQQCFDACIDAYNVWNNRCFQRCTKLNVYSRTYKMLNTATKNDRITEFLYCVLLA